VTTVPIPHRRIGVGALLRLPALALLLALAAMALPAQAAIDPLPFENAEQRERFNKLAVELRCVMCQNQSLADSNAAIASDLRREIFDLMQAGKSDEEIKHFLVERYTDFVLYRPPLRTGTVLLWFGPLLILLAGGAALFVMLRRRAAEFRAQAASAPRNPEPEEW
jgi:cytochrome c-type biogenesis protein CcmH